MKLSMIKSQGGLRNAKGFSLIELFIVLAVIAALVAAAVLYQRSVQNSRVAGELLSAQINLVSKVRQSFGSVGFDGTTLTPAVINNLGGIVAPLRRNPATGAVTSIESPFGQISVLGHGAQFSVTQPVIDRDACITLVNGLWEAASSMGMVANLPTGTDLPTFTAVLKANETAQRLPEAIAAACAEPGTKLLTAVYR